MRTGTRGVDAAAFDVVALWSAAVEAFRADRPELGVELTRRLLLASRDMPGPAALLAYAQWSVLLIRSVGGEVPAPPREQCAAGSGACQMCPSSRARLSMLLEAAGVALRTSPLGSAYPPFTILAMNDRRLSPFIDERTGSPVSPSLRVRLYLRLRGL